MQNDNYYRFLTGLKILLWLFLLSVSIYSVFGQDEETEDQTYSPRFYIPNSDTTLDALPLKSTFAHVTIAGVIADVTITQTYANEGTRTIEAKYVFPASTRAAVYYLHMKVGNRLLVAQVKEKEEAQQIYQEALDSGATVTLLEQLTPNVFQMNVGNILPGDTIEIELKYTELLVPENAIYEFVFPTVVGPRYTGGKGDEWTEGPYQHEGEEPLYDFDIDVEINAGMPLQDVTCTSYPEMEVSYFSSDHAIVQTKPELEIEGNKDFILQYRLSSLEIGSGFLAYEGEKENFFLAMMQPPNSVEEADIPPREYVFIMDVSGSMNGFPISVSKSVLHELLPDLRSEDKFNILFFAGGSYTFSPNSVYVTPLNISDALEAIDNQQGGGGTELLPALENALAMEGTEDYSRTFVILTDGYVTVEKEAFELIQNNLGEANFFAFGIGSSVNRYIIEGIAHVGQGEPFVATDETEAEELAAKFRKYIESPVLTNINANFGGFHAYDIEPQNIPDVFAERPVIIYGKYNGALTGSITLYGNTGGQDYLDILQIGDYTAQESNRALMYLWARKRIQLLDDYTNLSYEEDSTVIEEIIDLGLQYNLLSAYTSFIVVDSIIRCDTCTAETVNQPLPMPEGVTDNALANSGYWGSTSTNEISYNAGNGYTKTGKSTNRPFIDAIYPNPVTDHFTINLFIPEFALNMPKLIEVYDMQGRLVSEINLNLNTEGFHTVYLSLIKDLNIEFAGNYLVVLKVNSIARSSEIINVL